MSLAISDAELVHAARAGDGAALGALLERYRGSLYAAALAILRNRAQAQDAVQDTFLVALRQLDNLREPAAAGAWLHAIVRNASRMHLRAGRELPVEDPATGRAGGSEAEEALERLVLREWVWTALEELPEELRATVMLRFFTRHASYAEIAAILGIPVGTVRSRLNQAKRRLADALLEAAAAAHSDHAALVEQRWREWTAVISQVECEGTAALYVVDCSPEVVVEAPSLGYRARGAEEQRRDVEESAAAGVRLHLSDIVTSTGVTIVEGDYENPAHDPHHCPSTHTEVRFHPQARTTRLILYFGHHEREGPEGMASR